jgi:osmotically-inducible protein OsmY
MPSTIGATAPHTVRSHWCFELHQAWGVGDSIPGVQGVVGVANDLEVRLPSIHQRPDPDIARDAVEGMKMQLPYSYQNFKVIVRDGWITLEGETEWNYQKEKAEMSVRGVKGAKGVINSITVKPKIAAQEIKRQIEAAFMRVSNCAD